MKNLINRTKLFLSEILDFQSRVWVINISGSLLKEESFIINEDDFKEPLQWMKRKKYSNEMLDQVENLKLSQAIVFHIDNQIHRLIRVK